MEALHKAFLLELEADETPHSGRTLFEHLKGTHDLLRDWGNDQDVCNAGLFHSIYGTDAFKHVSLNERPLLVEMIGERAELLVHCFATKKRPFFDDVDDEMMRNQLMEIEAANLIEQSARTMLSKLAVKKISNSAKAAIAMELSR